VQKQNGFQEDSGKDNGTVKLALSLLIQTGLSSIISLILFSFFGIFFNDQTLILSVTIAGVLMLLGIGYTASWHTGERDYNKVKYKHIDYVPLKGLYGGLLSQAPLLIVAVLSLLLEQEAPWLMVLYKFLFSSIIGIFDLSEVTILFYFLPVLLIPAAALPGYIAGYKHFSITDKIVYRKKGNKPADGRRKSE